MGHMPAMLLLSMPAAALGRTHLAGICCSQRILQSSCHAMFVCQAKLEAEMRECERRREEVVESEAQAAQVAATLNARLEAAQKEGAAAAAALNARLEAAQKEGATAAAALQVRPSAALQRREPATLLFGSAIRLAGSTSPLLPGRCPSFI